MDQQAAVGREILKVMQETIKNVSFTSLEFEEDSELKSIHQVDLNKRMNEPLL